MLRILSVGALNNELRQHDETLRKAGFTVSLCNSAVRAKRLLGRPDRYDMLLIGDGVPQRQRDWLLGYARETSPETRILSLSATNHKDTVTADIHGTYTSPERIVMTVRRLAGEVLTADELESMSVADLPRKDIKILYVANSESVAFLRKSQLQAAGYDVQAAVSVQNVELACKRDAFQLVVFSPAIGPRMKLRIACAVRQRVPMAQILETGTDIPQIESASCTLGISGPELLKAIESGLRSKWSEIPARAPRPLEIN